MKRSQTPRIPTPQEAQDQLWQLAEQLVNRLAPQTLDDLRRWPTEELLLEFGLPHLITRHTDRLRKSVDWCVDDLVESIPQIGALNILANGALHTTEDLVKFLSESHAGATVIRG